MELSSGQPVTHKSFIEMPITDLVIKAAVKVLAAAQQMKPLKFTNHHKIPTHPADWIEGVEYKAKDKNTQYNKAADDNYNSCDI